MDRLGAGIAGTQDMGTRADDRPRIGNSPARISSVTPSASHSITLRMSKEDSAEVAVPGNGSKNPLTDEPGATHNVPFRGQASVWAHVRHPTAQRGSSANSLKGPAIRGGTPNAGPGTAGWLWPGEHVHGSLKPEFGSQLRQFRVVLGHDDVDQDVTALEGHRQGTVEQALTVRSRDSVDHAHCAARVVYGRSRKGWGTYDNSVAIGEAQSTLGSGVETSSEGMPRRRGHQLVAQWISDYGGGLGSPDPVARHRTKSRSVGRFQASRVPAGYTRERRPLADDLEERYSAAGHRRSSTIATSSMTH